MPTDPRTAAPHHDARAFGELLAALDQEAMIGWLGSLMGSNLRQHVSPEDLWQDTLAMAWRDRQQHEWNGLSAFRAWLRGIARHRLHDAAEWFAARKRGGTAPRMAVPDDVADAWLQASTTPSRQVSRFERARALQSALEALPDEFRELVRQCLFEELPVPTVARALGIGESTAYRRLLRGAELFRARIRERLGEEDLGPRPER